MSKQEKVIAQIVKLRHWGPAEAEAVIAAWRQSGESLGRFARRWKLTPARVEYWLAKQSKEEEEPAPVTFHPVELVEPPVTQPVTQPQPVEPHQWVAELSIASWTVRVPAGFLSGELKRLLMTMEEVQSC